MTTPRIAVIGGGWAGIAAALEATLRGHAVTLFEMAPQLGGRARAVDAAGLTLDNGQHILIGAYTETLRLMRAVGVDVDAALLRTPLRVVDPQGLGLQLPVGPPLLAFARGVLARRGWSIGERLALLRAAAGWWRGGFRCDESSTVQQLCGHLPKAVREDLIEPLCIAALNTPAAAASARVFLRVLHDALFAGPGSADLLLPRVSLSALLPGPAARWLASRGATVLTGRRVQSIEADGRHWHVDGERFDGVVLACTAVEAARLAEPLDAAWAAQARALRYEPIVTIYLRCDGMRLAPPMLSLRSDEGGSRWPAQFVFDLGALGGAQDVFAFVVSGAQRWVDAGLQSTGDAALTQARAQLAQHLRGEPVLLRVLTEKRATFRCTPGLQRPPARIAAGLCAAGDYIDGPYPATLEGAVRSAIGAIGAIEAITAARP